MIGKAKRISLYFFILFSTVGFCLYIGFFSFYLVKIKTSPLIISVLIGSTALSSLFWGPFAGKIIDRINYRFALLTLSQLLSGVLVFLFGLQSGFDSIITPVLVILFSLIVNASVIIVNQYFLPLLHSNYEESISIASYITGMAVFCSGVALALLYDKLPTIYFFTVSAICFFCSALAVLPFVKIVKPISNEDESDSLNEETHSVYYNAFLIIKNNWFLSLSMCILAFTETSFNTNFDVIAFSLGTTPFYIIFLMGAFSGLLDSFASWIYPKTFGKTSVSFRWNLFLSLFMIIFFCATLLSFIGIGENPWFLPILAMSLEIAGIWWAIFIAGRVREASGSNSYGQTMASFRVPRSIITFLGVTSIGSALQAGKLEFILLLNTSLLVILLTINIFQQSRHKERHSIADSEYKSE